MPIQRKFEKVVLPAQPITAGPRLLSNKDLDSVRQDVMTKQEVAAFLRVEPSQARSMNSHGSAAGIPCRSVVLESIYVSAGQSLSAGGVRQLEEFFGGPTRTRTWNLRIMSPML